jgi:hypothetical protein
MNSDELFVAKSRIVFVFLTFNFSYVLVIAMSILMIVA